VPRLGLKAPFRGGTVLDVARSMVTLAEAGLKGRARLDRNGEDESRALAPLVATVATGHSPSDRLLAAYHGPWAGDIDRIFDTQAL
jgi:glutamate--cysteine ligase